MVFWLWQALIDGYRRRRMSTLRNAQKGLAVVTIFSCLLYAQMFYCYEANLSNAPLKCYGKTIACRLITDLTYAFTANIIPLIIMVIFGSMTIINVRQTQRRVRLTSMASASVTNRGNQLQSKRVDHYLFLMLLVQVILFAVFTLPQNIQKFLSLAQTNDVKSALDRAIDNFIFNFFLLFAYLANGMSFYIYTLSGGSVFRNEVVKLGQHVCEILSKPFHCLHK